MIDFDKIETYPIKERDSKEKIEKLDKEITFIEDSKLKVFSERIIHSIKNKKKIIFMIGGHVVKTGMSQYIIDLMKKGFVSHIAMNGSVSIHDFELAMVGKTSEDVERGIANGKFGMVDETGKLMNNAIKNTEEGYGYAIGKEIFDREFPYRENSILYNAYRLGIPATVHVAIGTDIIHQHPCCDGSALGKSSYIDFKKFTDSISKLNEGVVLNIGSAVIMPEVFLKALTIARNLKYSINNITTANFDMIDHYRPRVNVVERPTKALGGKGFIFIGKHQELIPSLHKLLIDKFPFN